MPATNKTLFCKAEITNTMTMRLFEIMCDVTVSVDKKEIIPILVDTQN
jgi:hypothetical protein